MIDKNSTLKYKSLKDVKNKTGFLINLKSSPENNYKFNSIIFKKSDNEAKEKKELIENNITNDIKSRNSNTLNKTIGISLNLCDIKLKKENTIKVNRKIETNRDNPDKIYKKINIEHLNTKPKNPSLIEIRSRNYIKQSHMFRGNSVNLTSLNVLNKYSKISLATIMKKKNTGSMI